MDTEPLEATEPPAAVVLVPTAPPPASFGLHLGDIATKVAAIIAAVLAAGVIPSESIAWRIATAVLAVASVLGNAGVKSMKTNRGI